MLSRTITRRRFNTGTRDSDTGEYSQGAFTDTEIKASIQPVDTSQQATIEGFRAEESIKVFSSEPVRVKRHDLEADQLIIDDEIFIVMQAMVWPTHTHAVAVYSAPRTRSYQASITP